MRNTRQGNISIDGKCQRTRDRSCRHGEKINTTSFFSQRTPLIHAKAMLLINYDKRQLAKVYAFREQQMYQNDGNGTGGKTVSIAVRSAAGVEPVTSAHGISAAVKSGPIFSAYCFASTDVGAIMAACVPNRQPQQAQERQLPSCRYQRHPKAAGS